MREYKTEDNTTYIFEPEVAYMRKSSPLEHIRNAKNGISISSVKRFQHLYELTHAQSSKLLHVSEPTLYRWIHSNKNLNSYYAVLLFELVSLFDYGSEVFQSRVNFLKWLRLSNVSLGGMKPTEILEYPDGISKVKAILGRIEYGVYS